MSFAHGAQDGLKFIGILSIYMGIITGGKILENKIPIIFICALTMGVGILIGGKRIVTTVGEKIVKLENIHALCSDISTILTLILASLFGMPVSTTHVKTISVANASDNINKGKFKEIAICWGITFPICALVAFTIMKIIV